MSPSIFPPLEQVGFGRNTTCNVIVATFTFEKTRPPKTDYTQCNSKKCYSQTDLEHDLSINFPNNLFIFKRNDDIVKEAPSY